MINQDRLYSHIGEQLKMHREKIGITQSELAERVQLERTSITNIERGKQKLPIHVLFGVCRALGVNPSEVLPRMDLITESPVLTRVSIGSYNGSVPMGIARLMTGELN